MYLCDLCVSVVFFWFFLTNAGGLIPLPLQAASFVSGSKSPLQNLITNYELRIILNPVMPSDPVRYTQIQ
jgi:hypothetical protein